MLVDKLHLNLDVKDKKDEMYLAQPLSWYGRTCRDGTGKYWSWGKNRFYLRVEGTKPPGDTLHWANFYSTTAIRARIRPVLYYLGQLRSGPWNGKFTVKRLQQCTNTM